MAQTTAEILVDGLIAWGIDTIFGLPGDGINGIMEALRKREWKPEKLDGHQTAFSTRPPEGTIRFIQVRHEEAAAFMACGYAKYTGRIGCCIATSGPGGLHLLAGLYDAKMDSQPVLAITGLQYHDLIGTKQQQDVQLDRVFEDVAVFNSRVMSPSHTRAALDLACHTALARRGVAHLTIPVDIQIAKLDEHSMRNVPGHSGRIAPNSIFMPPDFELERAAQVLSEGKKIAILIGQGAIGAGDEVTLLSDKLKAPVIKALLGKTVIPDNSPFTTGGIGLLGTGPSEKAMKECDTLLICGSSFPYIDFYPKPGEARIVQIDIDASRIGLRAPVEVGIHADAKSALQRLLELVKPNDDSSFLDAAQAGMREWYGWLEAQGTVETMPLKPQAVAWQLNPHIKDDAIIATDTGNVTVWAARFLMMKPTNMFSASGTLASMANGLPYAIAAQVAHPERQVIALVGDGGFSMLMAEFATCVKYQLPIKVILFRNDSLGMIKWEQIAMMGNPEYQCDLQPIEYARVVEAMGGVGMKVDNTKDLVASLDSFFALQRPALLECVIDPNEPPLPPQITIKEAVHFVEAMIKGEPHRKAIVETLLGDKFRQMI